MAIFIRRAIRAYTLTAEKASIRLHNNSTIASGAEIGEPVCRRRDVEIDSDSRHNVCIVSKFLLKQSVLTEYVTFATLACVALVDLAPTVVRINCLSCPLGCHARPSVRLSVGRQAQRADRVARVATLQAQRAREWHHDHVRQRQVAAVDSVQPAGAVTASPKEPATDHHSLLAQQLIA